jgi:hypothetical protein
MRPDGRTVQVHCTLEARAEPGVCETPRAPGQESRPYAEYGAVAENAAVDSDGLLLRSGSNPLRQRLVGRRLGDGWAKAGHG